MTKHEKIVSLIKIDTLSDAVFKFAFSKESDKELEVGTWESY